MKSKEYYGRAVAMATEEHK